MDHFNSAHDAVVKLRPDVPLAVNRPHLVRAAARWFLDSFEGDILYAVKANPSPWVLEALWREGVRHFDVASVNECKLVRDVVRGFVDAGNDPVQAGNTTKSQSSEITKPAVKFDIPVTKALRHNITLHETQPIGQCDPINNISPKPQDPPKTELKFEQATEDQEKEDDDEDTTANGPRRKKRRRGQKWCRPGSSERRWAALERAELE
jgi:hypothetical protein